MSGFVYRSCKTASECHRNVYIGIKMTLPLPARRLAGHPGRVITRGEEGGRVPQTRCAGGRGRGARGGRGRMMRDNGGGALPEGVAGDGQPPRGGGS